MFWNQPATKQLVSNILLWLSVVLVVGIIHIFKGNDINSPFPVGELTRLIEPKLLAYVLFAGFAVFLIFSLIRHKSTDTAKQNRTAEFAGLALDEIGSALFNFGSLLMVCVFVGSTYWYIAAGLGCYSVGLYLKWANG